MKNEEDFLFKEIPYPELEPSYLLTQHDITFGTDIDPIKRMAIFSADEFENFIQLWVKETLEKSYINVFKCGGAGDKGRDVIAYIDKERWDNYQCKHYDKALSPNDIWIEIGKICYYTYIGSYTVPENYFFVSPKGVTTLLLGYLNDSKELKEKFLQNWDTKCKTKITSVSSIELTDELRNHIDSIDFSIFKHKEPLDLIKLVRGTMGYSSIFGGGLKRRREIPISPPNEIADKELTYTKKIFEAYSDFLNDKVVNETDIANQEILKNHFDRQRRYFYTAESLILLERDIREQDDDTITSIKDEIFDSIIDTLESNFSNAFERLKIVTERARQCDLSAHPLLNVTNENDKHGICHHLANENKIDWVNKNDKIRTY